MSSNDPKPWPEEDDPDSEECPPGIHCTKTGGCTMALHHIPPCCIEPARPCHTCGVMPWELCVRWEITM